MAEIVNSACAPGKVTEVQGHQSITIRTLFNQKGFLLPCFVRSQIGKATPAEAASFLARRMEHKEELKNYRWLL
jgi:hypothetical protein